LDEYQFSMPWSSHTSCGFTKTSTFSELIYTSTAEFSFRVVGPTSNRTVVNLFNFNIRIARQQTVTALLSLNLDSASVATVTASVVRNGVFDFLNKKTIVVFQTQTSWPYKVASPLTAPSSTGPTSDNANVVITPDYLTPDNCDSSSDASVCIQQFVAIITSPSCDPFGDYVFTTEVVCSDISTCTPVVGPNLTISVDHSDICTVALADPNRLLKHNLLSYSDPTFSTPKSDFQVGDQTFWTFVVIDPLVSIDSVILSSVTLTFEDGSGSPPSDSAYSSTGASSTAILNVVNATAYSSFPPGTAITVSFELDLSRSALASTIGQLNPSVAAETLSLEAEVTIQYHGNQKKRAVGGMSLFNNGRASSVASFVVRPNTKVLSSATKPLPAKQPSMQQNSLAGLVNFNSDNSICIGSSFLSCVVLSFVWNILGVLGF